MSASLPIAYRWTGEAHEPLLRFAREADRQFVVGEVYRLTAVEERSIATHNHMFACLHSAWMNLPDELAARFPSEEHLRKFALIKTGFYDKHDYVAATHREAMELAAFIRPLDSYAVVDVSGVVVTVYTAQSQSRAKADRKRFAEQKTKVLDYVADLIGVTTEELTRTAKENS